MRITRLLIGWTTLAALILMPAGEAWACQCEPTGPPCQNAFQVDAVFAATARSISTLREDGPPLRPGEARIPRAVRVEFGDVVAFRGISTSTVSVVTAGSGPACGYAFKPGERYLGVREPDQGWKGARNRHLFPNEAPRRRPTKIFAFCRRCRRRAIRAHVSTEPSATENVTPRRVNRARFRCRMLSWPSGD